jgi:threonine/homoserine/homoserine lactone efflux protein
METVGMDGWIGFILAGFALTGSPGPNTLGLAAAGAAFGARRGVSYMSGLNVGMVFVMAITASGVLGVLFAVPGATPVITAVAVAYFAYLAFRIATAPPLSDEAADRRQPSFAGGVFQSLVNPKAYAAMAALFSGFVLVGESLALDAMVKVLVLAVVIASVNTVWLFTGAALTRFFHSPAMNRAINVGFAALLVVSVTFALVF